MKVEHAETFTITVDRYELGWLVRALYDMLQQDCTTVERSEISAMHAELVRAMNT